MLLYHGQLRKTSGLLNDFYNQFEPMYEVALKEMKKTEPKKTGEKCPKCGNDLVYKKSKFGEFIACLGKLLEEEAELKGLSKNSTIDSDGKSNMSALTEEDIKKAIDAALSLLCDYEADDAIYKLKKLLEMECRVDMVEKIYTAIEKIDDFEYDEAKEILQEILGNC